MPNLSIPTERPWTKGPWMWVVNPSAHTVNLMARRAWGDTVMTFRRWGMDSAAPAFCRGGLIYHAKEFAAIVPGREHHADWFRTLDHPDARLIAAAPELFEALAGLRDLVEASEGGDTVVAYSDWSDAVERANAALAKALGQSTEEGAHCPLPRARRHGVAGTPPARLHRTARTPARSTLRRQRRRLLPRRLRLHRRPGADPARVRCAANPGPVEPAAPAADVADRPSITHAATTGEGVQPSSTSPAFFDGDAETLTMRDHLDNHPEDGPCPLCLRDEHLLNGCPRCHGDGRRGEDCKACGGDGGYYNSYSGHWHHCPAPNCRCGRRVEVANGR